MDESNAIIQLDEICNNNNYEAQYELGCGADRSSGKSNYTITIFDKDIVKYIKTSDDFLSERAAERDAAKKMIKILKEEIKKEIKKKKKTPNAISQLNEICQKENLTIVYMFSNPEEQRFSCTVSLYYEEELIQTENSKIFDSKKGAKIEAAEKAIKNFDHDFNFDKKIPENFNFGCNDKKIPNAISQLNEICQKDNLKIQYEFDNPEKQRFSCTVSIYDEGELIHSEDSEIWGSKKDAKIEAAEKAIKNFDYNHDSNISHNIHLPLGIKDKTHISLGLLGVSLAVEEGELNKIFGEKIIELTLAYQEIKNIIN